MTRAEGQDSPSSPDPDLPLVTAMVRGDTAALEELYQRWGHACWLTCTPAWATAGWRRRSCRM